ncbi:transglycosylase domain-containing protein [Aquiluna sp.]|nr:transglycosylase domain-containing protein [Aquiluna sp.]MDA7761033.1 transglycosylase domain-containing protein [Aquiluna sp.]MDA8927491.1 transglycosylase domain-containing protein [Aquiluna sp.]
MSGSSKSSTLASLLKFGLLSAVAGILSVSLLAPAVAVAGVVTTSSIGMFEGLPDYIKPVNASQSSTVYALRDGKPEEIATFFHENRVEVPFEEISENLINAVVATEDPRFYEHGGVDIISLIRATLTNLATFGEGPGASTITMQYVRQSMVEAANLSDDTAAIQAATEVSVERKLREIRLAIALEKQVSKKEILAGYLNLVFLGNQINGVETASQYYFGKSAKTLNVPQAAYLAGMLKSPNDYKPDNSDNLERGLSRRNYVIQNMADEGYITQGQADSYKASPIQTSITKNRQGCEESQVTAFFCDYTVWTIRNSPEFGVQSEDREMLLRRGGLEIYTTIDLDIQQAAWDAVMTNLPPENEWGFGTASVSVEVGTGRIVAMAQNRFFDQSETPEIGHTSVNFNSDKPYGGSSGFQPGSTYKVFTLAEWFKNGYTLGDHVDGRVFTGEDIDLDGLPDEVKIWDVSKDFQASCGGLVGLWEVNNSGDNTVDDITVLEAVVTSQNTAFASMASQLDLCAIRDTAAAFGVHRADGDELLFVPSAILGTNEIAPLTMAAAYAGISNGGVYCSPIAIDRVVLRKTSEEIPVPESLCNQSVSPEVAAAMIEAMKRVVSGGTGTASNTNDGTPLAGKTGTTDDGIHTWMVGFSSEVATASWVGNVVGLVPQKGKSVNGRAVSTIRHAVWRDVMLEVNKHYEEVQFPAANPRYVVPSMLTIPTIAGFDLETAKVQLITSDLNVQVVELPVASSQLVGTVAYTFPPAGEPVPRGSIIEVYISSGGQLVMPDVSGLSLQDATFQLEIFGLFPTYPQPSQYWMLNLCNPELETGSVHSTIPAAGEDVLVASAVIVQPNACG